MKATPQKTTTLRKPKGPENKWTPEEDEILSAAVNASGFKVCWRKIALSLPGRTNKSCRKRWIHSLDPTLKKGRWTAQEDKILLNAIKTHGTLWYKVAKHLPGRTDDQAAKRFREKLDPSISRTPWTEEEDEILVKMWRQVGKRWNLISKELNGRPAVHCRNRWQSLFRVGKVDGLGQGAEPDFTMDDDDTKDEQDPDEGGEVFLSPTEPAYIPRLSASSSSSSSPASSHLSTPIHTSHGLSDHNNDSVFLSFNSQSKQGEEEGDYNDEQSSFHHLPLASPAATRPSTSAGFFELVDDVLANGASRAQRLAPGSGRADPFSSLSTSSPRNSKSDMCFRFSDNDSKSQLPSSSRPAMFMVPHPNMRILSGPNQQQHAPVIPTQDRQNGQQNISQRQQYQFNYGHSAPPPPPPSSPSFYLPPYNTAPHTQQQLPSISTHHNFVSSTNSHPLTAHLPQLQAMASNNFILTCPLVHCGFQSSNLVDLWKHVTWDHVGATSSTRPNFDLEMPSDFGTTMKMDPGMVDYVERVVLDLDTPHHNQNQHQHHHHDKRGEMDIGGMGFGLGLQLDQLDVCGRGVHVASA